MNKYFILLVVVESFLAIECLSFGQPAGGPGGSFGAGRGGLEGIGGGMTGRGMGRGMRIGQRPAKAERLASLKELEKQIEVLKAAIEKAPDKDPNIVNLKDTDLGKFMDVYTHESDAINNIQKTLSFLSGMDAGLGAGGGLTSEIISELITLAEQEKAVKLTLRLETLDKETQASASRGGGMMGGRRGTSYTIPEGGFKYND
ncbi:MAG: hypothetical protein JW787_00320 [Sedimentisphaerales bacterium]|nr:hypothetical protein [Sedimentisphaerales bacterium]